MEDVKFYEFLLKITTYLNRQKLLSDKFMEQEAKLIGLVMGSQISVPPEFFNAVFAPMVDTLNARIETLKELREAGEEFQKQLQEFYNIYKGIIQ
jgi:hypothetical protein